MFSKTTCYRTSAGKHNDFACSARTLKRGTIVQIWGPVQSRWMMCGTLCKSKLKDGSLTQELFLLLQRQLVKHFPEYLDGGVIGPVLALILCALRINKYSHAEHLQCQQTTAAKHFQTLGLGIENQFQFQNQILKVRNRIHVVKLKFQFHLSIPVCASFIFMCRKGAVQSFLNHSFKRLI